MNPVHGKESSNHRKYRYNDSQYRTIDNSKTSKIQIVSTRKNYKRDNKGSPNPKFVSLKAN